MCCWAFSGSGPFLTFAFGRRDVGAIVSYYALLANADPHLSPFERLRSGEQCPPMFIARGGKDIPQVNQSVDAFVRR